MRRSHAGSRFRSARRRAGRALLLLPLLLSAACAEQGRAPPGAGSAGDSAADGGTVVIAYFADFPALDVLHTFDVMASQVQRDMLYMPLVRFDAGGDPEPWLAASWDTVRFATDSIQLTFHLRQDVRWHDGTPTTAEDVRFTFDRMKDPRTAAVLSRMFTRYSPHAEVLDPYTIRFRLRAHGGFLLAWLNAPPLPAHRLAEVPPEELATHPFGREPLGNGAFRFLSRTTGHEWVFSANPDFPAALGGRPELDRVVIRAVPEENARVVGLQTGRIHVTGISSAQVARLRQDPTVQLIDFETTRWTSLFWNSDHPAFSDVRVRRALTMAIDRVALTDAVLHGEGTAGRSPVTPFYPYFDADDPATTLPYDPEAARALLAAAGWSSDGAATRSGGTVRNSAGAPLQFTISVMSASQEHSAAAEIIQADLARIGVGARVRRMEYNTLIQQAIGGNGAAPPDAMIMSVAGELRKNDSFLFHSRYLDDANRRMLSYSDPRLDELLDTLSINPHDERMAATWLEYQRLLARDAPVSVLYYPPTHVAVVRTLSVVDVDGRGMLHGINRWRFTGQH